MSDLKTITIVTSAYNEAGCVDELAHRLNAVFETLPAYEFRVVVVENGSDDGTFELLERIHERDARFQIVQLARNFRMDGGLTAGLDYSDGDAVVLMAADLQDRPEDIPRFVALWEQGYENVYGIVTERGGTGPLRRFNSRLFYWVMNKLSEQVIPTNASDFRLLDRRVYEQVREMEERNRFVRGLVAWVGFRSIGVEIVRPERFAGESKAHSFHVLQLALRAVLAHSMRPLYLMPLIGVGLFAASLAALAGLAIDWVFNGVPFPGFGTIVALMVMMFGVMFCFLGVIGFYIGLIYEEVRGRPNYVPRRTVGFDTDSGRPDGAVRRLRVRRGDLAVNPQRPVETGGARMSDTLEAGQ